MVIGRAEVMADDGISFCISASEHIIIALGRRARLRKSVSTVTNLTPSIYDLQHTMCVQRGAENQSPHLARAIPLNFLALRAAGAPSAASMRTLL